MYLKTIAFNVFCVFGHIVQSQSSLCSDLPVCPEPEASVIVNNPCNPLLDKKGIDISVEPLNTSSLYNRHIVIPPNQLNKWQFLRIDCSKRNGTPLNVDSIKTYKMPYIIALVNCTIDRRQDENTDISREGNWSIDTLLVNCNIKSSKIPVYGGLIIQSSKLPPSFYCWSNLRFVALRSLVESSFNLVIQDRLSELIIVPDYRHPLKGTISVIERGDVAECDLGNSEMRIDLDSNYNLIRQCGLKKKWEVLLENFESNIDIIILVTFSLLAIVISSLDPKQRAQPVASLSVSFLSTYSAVSRIGMAVSTNYKTINYPQIVFYAVMFLPIFISICHSIYMTRKLCRRYDLPNNVVTWLLIILGPSNFKIFWSKFLGLTIFSQEKPNMKPEILGLLELNRSIAQDIGVAFLTELFNTNVSIKKILRNCVTVFSLLHILTHWKAGKVYAKIGCVVLVIPAVVNIALLFPGGLLYERSYAVYMFCLSLFAGILIGIAKFTATESKYAGIWFILGPVSVVVGNVALMPFGDFKYQLAKGGDMLFLTILSFFCLLNNIWHYKRIWIRENEENISHIHKK